MSITIVKLRTKAEFLEHRNHLIDVARAKRERAPRFARYSPLLGGKPQSKQDIVTNLNSDLRDLGKECYAVTGEILSEYDEPETEVQI